MEKIAKNLQLILMVIILISTVIAVGIEIYKMFQNRAVTLADLLLMFLNHAFIVLKIKINHK